MIPRHAHARLYAAQGGLCAICGETMPPPSDRAFLGRLGPDDVTFDHVWPRRPTSRTRYVDGTLRHGLFDSPGGDRGNGVATHRRCNEAKANRPPTGCEQIMLQLVNARLYDAQVLRVRGYHVPDDPPVDGVGSDGAGGAGGDVLAAHALLDRTSSLRERALRAGAGRIVSATRRVDAQLRDALYDLA